MNRLEELRKSSGLSIKELCDSVCICEKTYYWYAKRNRPIPSDKLILFAKIFQVSTDYVLGAKNHTQITVVDKEGAVVADISQTKIIEHKDYKVILT